MGETIWLVGIVAPGTSPMVTKPANPIETARTATASPAGENETAGTIGAMDKVEAMKDIATSSGTSIKPWVCIST